MIRIVRQNYKKNLKLFNKVKNSLLNVLDNDVLIEHIGSTAIPKMSGKNIIDIVIGVDALTDMEKTARALEIMNFYRGKNNYSGEYIFFASRKEETKSGDIHLHLVLKDSKRLNEFLALKTYLLNYPEAAKEYIIVKHRLAKQALLNRENYKLLKGEYMNGLLEDSKKTKNGNFLYNTGR